MKVLFFFKIDEFGRGNKEYFNLGLAHLLSPVHIKGKLLHVINTCNCILYRVINLL
jgi:hypothetical protein